MKAIKRLSSRSKPRRLGISSRKSVSANACSSSIRACARANWARNFRIAGLASSGMAGGRDAGWRLGPGWRLDGLLRPDTALDAPRVALLRLAGLDFAAFEPGSLVFFFMKVPERLAAIHQD